MHPTPTIMEAVLPDDVEAVEASCPGPAALLLDDDVPGSKVGSAGALLPVVPARILSS